MSFEQNLTEWYQNYLGRAPDQSGWDNYMGQLQGGRNVYEVAHEIQYSKEGRDYAASQDAIRRGHIADAQRHANDRATKAENELAGLKTKVEGYEKDIDDYKFKQNQLQGQYTAALGQVQNWTTKANEFQKKASDFENQFNQRTQEYEAARSEADMYRNQAVGAQLRALRSGATSGGGNQTGGAGGNLASGRPQYQNMDDKAVQVEKNIQAESGALSNKGPVVERINRRPSGGGSTQGRRSPLAQGAGSGSYYASRFR